MTFKQYINHATKHPTFLLQTFFQMTFRHLAALAGPCMAYCILFKNILPSFLSKIANNTHKLLQVAFFFLFQLDTPTLLLRTLFYYSVNLSRSLGNYQMSGYYKRKVCIIKDLSFSPREYLITSWSPYKRGRVRDIKPRCTRLQQINWFEGNLLKLIEYQAELSALAQRISWSKDNQLKHFGQ